MNQQSHSHAYTLRKPKLKKDTCIPLFIAALLTIASTWKQPRCPSKNEWIQKFWYIYTMKYYSAIKRNAFESILMRWMNLEPIIQSEVSQREKDKYHVLKHIYGIQKNGILKTLFTGQEWRNRHREQICGHRERVRCMERVTWKLTLPYAKQIANGNLLYGSGNSNRGLY